MGINNLRDRLLTRVTNFVFNIFTLHESDIQLSKFIQHSKTSLRAVGLFRLV